jgi:antitoxin (DNA-binding transcriptional repressor) of toxin-antitoxin stability system
VVTASRALVEKAVPGHARAPHREVAEVASGSYIRFVRTVGLKVLKNKLSEYVRLASQGETVLIADRDRVVAELVPPQSGRAETVSDAVLASLVREGVVTPAMMRPGSRPRTPPPTEKLRDVLSDLDADRSER